jgi:hypothetical protein
VGGVGGALALALGFLWLLSAPAESSEAGRAQSLESVSSKDSAAALAQKIAQIDTDRDGLSDWEETLWKTDAENPDTDLDGTPDGEEVESGRDPTRAGPDDTIFENEFGASTENETDSFAQSFFTEYVKLRNSGLIDDPTARDALVRNFAAAANSTFAVNYLTESDIRVGSDGSPQALKNYANIMGAIMERHSLKENWDENEILLQIVEERSKEKLEDLSLIKNAYRSMIEEMRVVVTPQETAELHLSLLNGLTGIEQSIDALEDVLENPLVALSAMPIYQENGAVFVEAFVEIARILHIHNIAFEPTEPGHMFGRIRF